MDERKLFRDGKDEFEQVQSLASGLGPIFNDVSCVACHFAPAVGGSSGIIEARAQRVEGGNHFDVPGGSLFQSNGISPNCRESIPADANVIAQRQTTPLFGMGLIEAIPDAEIEAYRAEQDPGLAARRLAIFGSQSPSAIAADGLAYARKNGFADTDVVLIQELVTAMQAWSGIP